MAFKLYLTISGLCMFVPDEKNGVMHVLMPKARPPEYANDHTAGPDAQGIDGAEHHAPHVAYLLYDSAHRTPDPTLPDRFGDACAMVPLNGRMLEFKRCPGARPNLELSSQVVYLDKLSADFGGVPGKYLEYAPNDPLPERVAKRVAARVRILAGKAESYPEDPSVPVSQRSTRRPRPRFCLARRGAECHETPSGPRPQVMTEHVEWYLGRYPSDVPIADIFSVNPLGPEDEGAQWLRGRLSPRSGVQRVDLRLLYVLPSVMLQKNLCREYRFPPSGSGDFTHFDMFYELSATLPTRRVTPVPEDGQPKAAPSVVCMTARGSRSS